MARNLFVTCLVLMMSWGELLGNQAELLINADSFVSNRQYKQAIAIYAGLLTSERRANYRAIILHKLSFAEIQIRAFDEALQHVVEARHLHVEKSADSLIAENSLLEGMCHYWMERPAEAIKSFEYALARYERLHNKRGASLSLYWIGNIKSHGFFQFGESISYYKKALEKYPWPKEEQWAAIQMNLSKAYLFSNELKTSAIYRSNAEAFYRSKPIYTPELADCLNLSAINSVFGHDVTNFFRQAFQAVELLKGYDNYHLGKYYDNIGAAYKLSGKGSEALKYYREAARQHAKFSYNTYRISNNCLNIGEYFLDVESRLDSAIYYYRKCLAVRKKSFGSKHTETAAAYLHLGELFQRNKQYDSALYFFQEAMKSEVPAFTSDDVRRNPETLGAGYGLQLMSILSDKANTLRSKYADEHDLSILKLAFLTLVRADSLLSVYRTTLYWRESKLAFNEYLRMIYHQALEYGYLLHLKTGSNEVLEKCFYVMENARYTLLLENIRDSHSEIKNRESELKRILDGLSREITRSKANSVRLEQLQKRRDSAQQVMQHYYDNRVTGGRAFNKFVSPSVFANCQKFIQEEKSTFVNYFWADTVVYCIALCDEQRSFFKIRAGEKLLRDINRFKNLISHPPVSSTTPVLPKFIDEARSLYKTLLPFLDTIGMPSKLVVIPDGPLINLPFETLLAFDPDRLCQGFRCLPYLARYTTTEYWFSFSIMDQLIETAPSSVKSILALAPEYHDNLIPLHGASDETENLLSLGATVLKGRTATKLGFIRTAQNYNYLHIASHARADTVNGLNSYIDFSDDPDDRIYAYEFVDLKLSAKLVLLTSCETGRGEMRKGEGIFSLGRAFAAAGAESIVLSAWDVPDGATSKLVKKFYQHLLKGEAAPDALRNSKLEFLDQHDELSAHPYFWSSLYFIGHYRQPDSNWAFKWGVAITILALIASLIYIVRIVRKKARPGSAA